MKIKQIKSQHRRDFVVMYVCEHCGHEHLGGGYDDSYFHEQVIPTMKCDKCGKVSGDDYVPMEPKYPAYAVV